MSTKVNFYIIQVKQFVDYGQVNNSCTLFIFLVNNVWDVLPKFLHQYVTISNLCNLVKLLWMCRKNSR
jgi:hypothetical protein